MASDQKRLQKNDSYFRNGVELRFTRSEFYQMIAENWDQIKHIRENGGRPSIDRIGPSIHYEPGNVQFIPLADNCSKAERKLGYRKYLKSEWWQDRRLKALEIGGNKCAICGATEHLQVHHLNYDHRWCERDEDLEVRCGDCHMPKSN